ncbi:unnamed protein product, partial [Symbiodinium necroappetens]
TPNGRAGPTTPGTAPRRPGGRGTTPTKTGRPVRAAAANPRRPAGSVKANGSGARDNTGPWPARRLRNPTSPWPNARVSAPTALANGTSFCSPPSTALAPYIVDRDFGRPRLAVSWEVDWARKALVQQAMPWVEHRGDLTRDSPQDVADLVLEADPNAEAMVLWCAAPPCQDFSRIAKGAGHQGDRGRLFEDSVAFMDELRSVLRQHRFAFLYENVEMDAAAAKVSSDALGVVVTDPADGSPLEWAKRGRWDRLRLTAARSAADSFELGGLQFHSSVAQGRKLMPCATTPAPTDDGRPKPRSTRGRTPRDADARWAEGGRQFAPWHYTVEAMLQNSRGVLHIPPPDVKEQLHHIPAGYTATAGADTKTRHRMVGNGWHWGVAARLLGILAMATWAKPVASGRAPAPPPRQGTIPWLSQVWSRQGWDFSPPPRPTPAFLGAGLDEDAHWAAATGMQHSLVGWPQLEPALEA